MEQPAAGYNLFAYGTLLAGDIFLEAAGCRCRSSRAVLRDHRRLPVRGKEYPGLIPAKGFQVEGLVYHDIPAAAWNRLDRYEGEMYVRCPVEVETAAGKPCGAHVYIVRPAYRHHLEPQEWKPEKFLR
jgi:gamma-glutamylcyclotransferase (GGCT)/AIG2-like uncharacterized protein YtfP